MVEDISQWPTKKEARQLLGGVPERTFDRWLSEKNVKVSYRKVAGRRPIPVIDPACLPLFKQEIIAAEKEDERAVAIKEIQLPARRDIVAPQWRLFLTIEQASDFTGLTSGCIRRLIHGGILKPLRDGEGYKISRRALEALAG